MVIIFNSGNFDENKLSSSVQNILIGYYSRPTKGRLNGFKLFELIITPNASSHL